MSGSSYNEAIKAQLLKLLQHAYCPYSAYPVAAIIQTSSGQHYRGVNTENTTSPLTICAEQAAVTAMVTAGETDIRAMWLMTSGAQPATPCGTCRQVIAEFADANTPIFCMTDQGAMTQHRIDALIPHRRFGVARLPRKRRTPV